MSELNPTPQDPSHSPGPTQQPNGWGAPDSATGTPAASAAGGASAAAPPQPSAAPPMPSYPPRPAWPGTPQAHWNPQQPRQPQPRKSFARTLFKVLAIILFIGSVVVNVLLVTLWLLPLAESGGLQSVAISSGSSGQVVAVYSVEGAIDDATAAEFRRFQGQVLRDSDIKAVVLRVNSPGGTVAASDEIHHMVGQIQQAGKPVVVSMGGVAASGGYYISAGAKEIVAEPTTITGSIGVISVWPVLKDFFDTHGIKVMTIRSKQAMGNKANENFWEVPSDRTRAEVQDMLSKMHEKFAAVVRAGRGNKLKVKTVTMQVNDGKNVRDIEQVEPLNGKVYLTSDAIANGLVDSEGYLADAVRAAGRAAGLSNPKEVHYVKVQSFRDLMGANESKTLIDAKAIEKFTSPQILMMWKAQ